MFHRPLAAVCGATLGDYLLWNWSLGGGHDVVAVISGLTLPVLVVASVWLIAISAARLIARSARRAPVVAARYRSHIEAQAPEYEPSALTASDVQIPAPSAQAQSPRKLAA